MSKLDDVLYFVGLQAYLLNTAKRLSVNFSKQECTIIQSDDIVMTRYKIMDNFYGIIH